MKVIIFFLFGLNFSAFARVDYATINDQCPDSFVAHFISSSVRLLKKKISFRNLSRELQLKKRESNFLIGKFSVFYDPYQHKYLFHTRCQAPLFKIVENNKSYYVLDEETIFPQKYWRGWRKKHPSSHILPYAKNIKASESIKISKVKNFLKTFPEKIARNLQTIDISGEDYLAEILQGKNSIQINFGKSYSQEKIIKVKKIIEHALGQKKIIKRIYIEDSQRVSVEYRN